MATGKPLPQWRKVQLVTIPAGSTVDVDTVPFSSFLSATYKLQLFSLAEDKFLGFEVRSQKENSTVEQSVGFLFGDAIAKTVQVLEVGSDVVLRIGNNEAFPISLTGLKEVKKI